MNKGLHGMHLAMRIKNYYYSPAQFAVAWIAAKSKSELRDILDFYVDKILKNRDLKNKEFLKNFSQRTPLLNEVVVTSYENGERFNISNLEDIARKHYGTAKIIKNNGPIFTDEEGKTEGISIRKNVFANVDTRRKRTAKNHPYNVSLYNSLADSIEYLIENFRFKGGTLHSFYKSDELSHWSSGIDREAAHLDNIKKNFGQAALNYYKTHIDIIDSGVAQALIQLNNELIKKKNGENSLLEIDFQKTLLPFDFNMAPDLALEAFLQLHYKKSMYLNKLNNLFLSNKRYFFTDIILINHIKDFTPPEYLSLIKKGKATIEVFISGKYFPKNDFSWAMIQALENHMHRKGRIFSGHTLEKIGERYFVGIGFKNTFRSQNQTSVRILYDDMFYPVVLYKTTTGDDINTGTNKHPMKLLNFSKPRNKYEIIWRDIDLKSGKKTINELFEPLPELIQEASNIMFENNIKRIDGISFTNNKELSRYILEKYISRRREYK